MTTAAVALTSAQIERANFLNLMIVDDERAIREVCREVAQSLGLQHLVADSAEHAYRQLDSAKHRRRAAGSECRARADSRPCARSANAVLTRW